jgi:transposase
VDIKDLNISETLSNAKKLLEEEKNISPALKAVVELLLTIITLFAGRLSLTSRNSNKPPSSDPNRQKEKNGQGKNKPGGQPGRQGVTLEPVKTPDKIVSITVDRSLLPRGKYCEVGFESRQIIELKIARIITEYRAQILEDRQGSRYVAEFPEGVTRPIQYGQSIKAHAVYLSLFQLLPYERVADYFNNEIKTPISVGSLFNFNQEAHERLEEFERIAKEKLIVSSLLHADETGINVNGKRLWLHTACNDLWTYFFPHEKRGSEAMDAIGILPKFKGRLVHDHWKPYFVYQCLHVLCNAHHIRELQWVIDNHSYGWPQKMQELLIETNEAVKASGLDKLESEAAQNIRLRYREILAQGKEEMPATVSMPLVVSKEGISKKKRGRKKKSKEMNLLERLSDYENEVLRFMEEAIVPFSNNRGENDIRMTKVQQKISGCFRSMDGAKIFCRVRSYLLTAQKHGISPTSALKMIFDGKLPEVFYTEKVGDLIQTA